MNRRSFLTYLATAPVVGPLAVALFGLPEEFALRRIAPNLTVADCCDLYAELMGRFNALPWKGIPACGVECVGIKVVPLVDWNGYARAYEITISFRRRERPRWTVYNPDTGEQWDFAIHDAIDFGQHDFGKLVNA